MPDYDSSTCYQAQLKMSLYIEDDPYLTDQERKAFESHLEICPECAREYEESKFVINFIKKYWPVSENTLALIEKASRPIKCQMTIEEGWVDLKRRIPELAQLEKRRKHLQLFRRVGAVAACLAIGILIFLAFSYPEPECAQESFPEQVALAPKPSVKVELVSDNGNILIPSGQQIKTSSNELKTLLLNGKHRMVLNYDTTLSIEPLLDNEHVSCLVKLASGEIFTHVEHDGNPFAVGTTHGKAIITGTTFDVKATDISTTLVVAESTVHFGSEEGFVEVAAGYTSEIAGRSTPTKPATCNTAELTAWATGHELKTALTKIQPYSDDYDLADLWLSANSGPIELESINYENWIEEQRFWFEPEFPWTAQLQSALAAEGIEVDYPELLISSGDIWQFVYPGTSPQQIPILYFDPLLKTASKYGFDKQWLMANIRAARFAIADPAAVKGRFTGSRAFEAWASCFEKLRKPQAPPDWHTLLYSIHAGTYLANTRILAGLSLMNANAGLPPEDKAKVLALLQTEVNTAYELSGRVMRLLVASEDQPCDDLLGPAGRHY